MGSCGPSRSLVWTIRVAAATLSVLFVTAAIGKITRPAGIEGVVRFLLNLPGHQASVVRSVVSILVFWEMLVGLMLILTAASVPWMRAAQITLIGFTATLVLLAMNPRAPACGCFGSVRAARNDAPLGITRNVAAMAVSCAPGLIRQRQRRESARDEHLIRRNSTCRRAFSLAETVIVLAVVALLLALLLPALAGSRFQAKLTKRTSLSQQVVTALLAYAHDHREAHLYFMTPGEPTRGVVFMGTTLQNSYFASGRNFWPNFLDSAYLSVPRQLLESGDTEGIIQHNLRSGVPAELVRSSVQASDTLYASPGFFEGPPAFDASACVGTRLDQVLFPSQKGYTVDRSMRRGAISDGRNAVIRGFGDASVDVIDQRSYVASSEGLLQRPFGNAPFNVLATVGGLHGRDR
jgi:type II secretory pathway pseudopilin PulG